MNFLNNSLYKLIITLMMSSLIFSCSNSASNATSSGATDIAKEIPDTSNITSELVGTITDSRDGQVYSWVKIGDQVWMSENLNYSGDDGLGNKIATVGYCYGESTQVESENCTIYGRLYNWYTAMDTSNSSVGEASVIKGICPSGWHVPSSVEWKVLNDYMDTSETEKVGKYLKANDTLWKPNTGSDDFAFSGLPGGYQEGSNYYFLGNFGKFWSSTERITTVAYDISLNSKTDYLYENASYKSSAFSVRCLQDKP